jgi:hypothetical protein
MRAVIDGHERGARPDVARIVADVGPLANAAPTASPGRASRSGRRRG